MSGNAYMRGGIPAHINRTTAADTVERWWWDGGIANHLWVRNTGANAVILSFTQADAEAGVGIALAAAALWEGPAEVGSFWTKSAMGTTFEAVAFVRRG